MIVAKTTAYDKTDKIDGKDWQLFYYNGKKRGLTSFIKNLWIRHYADRDFTVAERNGVIEQAIEVYKIDMATLNRTIKHPANMSETSTATVTVQTVLYDFISYPYAKDTTQDTEDLTQSGKQYRRKKYESNVSELVVPIGADSDEADDKAGDTENFIYKLSPEIYIDIANLTIDNLELFGSVQKSNMTDKETATMQKMDKFLEELSADIGRSVRELAIKHFDEKLEDEKEATRFVRNAIKKVERLNGLERAECQNCSQTFYKKRPNQKYCDYYAGANSCYEQARRR